MLIFSFIFVFLPIVIAVVAFCIGKRPLLLNVGIALGMLAWIIGGQMHSYNQQSIEKKCKIAYELDAKGKRELAAKLVGKTKKIHEQIASLYRELGKTIQDIRKKTEEYDVRLEDIITRECQINVRTARMAERASVYSIAEPLSQDIQQLITSQKDSIKIHSIIEGAKQGKTIYQVKEHLKTETQKPTNNRSNGLLKPVAASKAAEKIVDIKKVLTQGICHALGKIHEGATVCEVLEEAEISRETAVVCEVAEKDIERLEDAFRKIASTEAK